MTTAVDLQCDAALVELKADENHIWAQHDKVTEMFQDQPQGHFTFGRNEVKWERSRSVCVP